LICHTMTLTCRTGNMMNPRDAHPPASGQIVELGSARLYYETAGEGSGTVVFVHPISLDGRIWDEQFDALAGRYRLVRFDQRNHGRSGRWRGPYSPSEDLAALLDRIGVKRAALVGALDDAHHLVEMALTRPDLVRALILMNPVLLPFWPETAGGFDFDGQLREALESNASALEACELAEKTGNTAPLVDALVNSPNMPAGAARERLRPIHEANVEVYISPPEIMEVNLDATHLREITAPTLVVTSAAENMKLLGQLASQFPNGSHTVLAAETALANIECPGEFNAALAQFLERV
jgi:3-oxoadipate enol-lactonase